MTARQILAAMGLAALAAAADAAPAQAQEQYIGNIILVGYGYCPQRTLEADGQLLPISQNQALFSLYGCVYGGNCQSTFALPDLRGRTPIGRGQGSGLPNYDLGARGGATSVTQTVSEMPQHSHGALTKAKLQASSASATSSVPSGNVVLGAPAVGIYSSGAAQTALGDSSVTAQTTVGNAGGSQPMSIQDPYLALRYCVVTSGPYPARP